MTICIITIVVVVIIIVVIIIVVIVVIFLFEYDNIVNINYDNLIIKERLRDYNGYKIFY